MLGVSKIIALYLVMLNINIYDAIVSQFIVILDNAHSIFNAYLINYVYLYVFIIYYDQLYI